MSAFYDQASLVVVPSGYKSGKIYAQKPLTTDGQLTFTRASTATRVNASGLIEAVASGVPRLDYQGSTCPKLLLEPQRTNIALYSEQFNNVNWVNINTTVTANTTISPDGSTNADTIEFTASAGAVCQAIAAGAFESQTHTVSVYARVASGTGTFRLKCTHGAVVDYISSDFTATTTWQRFTFSATFGATIGTSIVYGVQNGSNATAKSVIFYGFQLEANAAYATSYIPTLGTSVTRVADDYAKTGVSSLIGQAEGTVFVDFTINGLQSPYASAISLNDGLPNNYIWLTIFSNGDLRAEVYAGGVVQASISFSGAVAGGRYKMACGYKTNDFVLYVNGALVGTDTSGSTFSGTTLSRIDNNLAGIAANITSQSTNQALLFKTRLTNAQLAELTTL
jgi:hypothetical protein